MQTDTMEQDNNPVIIPGTTEQDNSPKKYNKIDVGKALQLKLTRNWTYQQIADHFGVRKQSVHYALAKFKQILENQHSSIAYSDNREAILNTAEMVLITDLLDEQKREKASLNNTAYAFNTLHNARRLESGQSTVNNAVIYKWEGEPEKEDKS